MKRRDFSVATASALAASAFLSPALAQARKPDEGTDYMALDKRAPVEAAAGKIEVVEFFWYSCPHCNAFESKLESWIKGVAKDVAVRRVPVAFRDSFVPEQRLFYCLEALGRIDDLHRKVFYAIHVEKLALNKEETITAWAEKQGLDKAKFAELYNSFGVSNKARRAAQLQDAYKVSGVPALGVAGRFYTDGQLAQNMDRALAVTDYLIAEHRKKP
ncbi:MAG: thiol:disulfide interchange protein DsbA/DsbL [Burkholderiales bacterium]